MSGRYRSTLAILDAARPLQVLHDLNIDEASVLLARSRQARIFATQS